MMYRVTTGWYPSRATAEKVLTKVLSVDPSAELINNEGVFYSVSLGEFCTLEKALQKKDDMLKKKIFCGCECLGGAA